MRYVLANYSFAHSGGTEVYLLTVAEHIQRLGHEVSIYAHELGPFSEHAGERGIGVCGKLHELPSDCDAVLAQDAVVAYELADRYPAARHVFRACSDVFDFSLPPQLEGIVDMILVASDRYARLVSGCAVKAMPLRLRVPIDIDRYTPLGPIRPRPRRALLLGNYPDRRELVREVWERHGVEVTVVGGSRQRYDIAEAVGEVDIVVAKARAALDAMACGRAVYVFDVFGGDGWVTADSYAAMEADNFAGQATDCVIDAGALARDLAAYDPRMGVINRDLVVQHHNARDHVIDLVGAIGGLSPKARPTAPLRELARLTNLLWSSDRLARDLQRTQASLHGRVVNAEASATAAVDARLGAEASVSEAADALVRAEASVTEATDALACARGDAERSGARARELQATIDTMRGTTAWRLAMRYWRLKGRLTR